MIIAIVNQKGGCGKSTVAVNLAFGTASVKKQTALVDADEQGTCAEFYEGTEHLHIYQAGDNVREVVKGLKEPFIFIDTPPHSNHIMKLAMMAADLIIIPTQPSPYDLHSSGKTVEIYRDIQRKIGWAPPCYFLINRTKENTLLGKEAPDHIAEYFKLPVLKTHLHDYELYRQAPLAGQSVLQFAPKHKAAREIADLIVEMIRMYKTVKSAK